MSGVYSVWTQIVDDYTTPENIDAYGSVHDVLEEQEDDDTGTPNKQFCDGQTSKTPPRYAQDNMIGIYTRSEEAANMISGYLREDLQSRMLSGELIIAPPAWSNFTIEQLRTMFSRNYLSATDFKITAEQMPNLNSRQRNELQSEKWKAYLKTPEGRQRVEFQKFIEAVRERDELLADVARYQAEQAWAGNRQTARWVQNALDNAGISYHRIDAGTGSVYFEVSDDLKLRIADHEKLTELTRFVPPSHEVTPYSSSWRVVLEQFIKAVKK